jgi:hypothetical protein
VPVIEALDQGASRFLHGAYDPLVLDRTQTRALPLLNRAADYAPAAQACCGACRTCVQTNLFTLLAAGAAAVVGLLTRAGRRGATAS